MKRVILLLLIVSALPLFLIGQTCLSGTMIQRSIKAFNTDNNIDWELLNHRVFINTECTQNDKLLLHFVGSFDNPASTILFPTLATELGYKAINLKYPNGTPAITACGNSTESDCFQGFREEIIYGSDLNPDLEVDTNNCILNRTKKLLLYLEANFPSENWGSFLLPNNEINWSKIVVSGHSQGGGHAAYIAKKHLVSGVLMFASPNDYSTTFSRPASWISNGSLTPDSSYVAFGNLYDDVNAFSNQYAVWDEMRLLNSSDSINVDETLCDYSNSKVLYTKDTFSNPHSNMIIDSKTQMVNEKPIFEPVWRYMLGNCDLTTSLNDHESDSGIKLFPNPSSNEVNIESNYEISKVEVLNYLGKVIKTIYPRSNNSILRLEPNKGLLTLAIYSKNNTRISYRTVILK